MNSEWFAAPGVIFPECVSMHISDASMAHVLFVPPFLWGERLTTLTVGERQVAWLLAVPISSEERALAESKGAEALELALEEAQIDLFDVNRDSVV